MVDAAVLSQLDELQSRYILALDRQNMSEWYACFTVDDGSYECITDENVRQSLPIAVMLDDCPARLKDRVRFVTEVWAGTFEDYCTRHFVQRLSCAAQGTDTYAMVSNMMVAYTSARRHSEVLTAGRYEDEITIVDGVAKFRRKRAILDTVTTPRYLVYPI